MRQTEKIENSLKPVNRRIKLVVWDLDNTLWDGILSENDFLIENEKAIEAIKALDKFGIIHSVCSKNDEKSALAKLEKLGIKEYFLHPQINWENKSEGIRIIKEKLNIGFDAIAFIDDQPFERDEVNFVYPSVQCFDVDVIPQLEEMLKPQVLSEESSMRRIMYINDEKRTQEEIKINNNNKFLKSLGMSLVIKPAVMEDLARIEELTIRTHQLNATGYTYSYEELCELIHSPNYKIFVTELKDKYGTYGKVGIALLKLDEGSWTLKLLLVSCRVMSRGVGSVLLNHIIAHSIENSVNLFAEFLPTEKNRIMYIAYKLSGFEESGELENGGVLLKHNSKNANTFSEYMKVSFHY